MNMVSVNAKARDLTEYMRQLINQFQFLKSDVPPPDYEFSFRELRIILYLGYNGSSIMREIADANGLPLSTATGIVDRLVEKDLVKRERVDDDRRIVKVELTDQGSEVYQWDFEEHAAFVRELLDSLEKDDQKTFITLMKKIVDSITPGSSL